MILKPNMPNFIEKASGDAHIEFQGNKPDVGEPNSPLEYTFTAPKDGNFRLLMIVCVLLTERYGMDIWTSPCIFDATSSRI